MKKVAKVLLFNGEDKLLVLRRSLSHPHFPHHFDFPGGEIEERENFLDAVRREVYEETSLTLADNKLELVYEQRIDPDTHHQVIVVYLKSIELPIKLSWEHDAFFWMDVSGVLDIKTGEETDEYFLTVRNYLSDCLKSGSNVG